MGGSQIMTNRPRRWVSIIWFGVGLLTLTALWLPIDATDMSFSGPSRVVRSWGILSSIEVSTRYAPRRMATTFNSRPIAPPAPMPGEIVWDHHGDFGNDVVFLAVKEHTVSVNRSALGASVLATILILWLTVVRQFTQRRINGETITKARKSENAKQEFTVGTP
jgi:hypothetical protein